MDEEYNDSFYPFIDYITESVSDIELEEDDTLPLYREIAWDFKNEHPLIINNEFKIVEENEAICVWIWHAIKTFRYYYSIYSWDYESRETPYYLMIDQLSGKGQITVKYWTTNCEVGNRIQAGVNLSPNATTYLDSKTLALVSTTYGGKQAPKNREQIDIYKYGFISHGRILTQNDIASFCKKELGELLVRTEIRNGVEISPMPHEGLVRTKEVHLILGTKLDEPSQEKQIKDNLRTKLSACSPDTFNYRIFIEYNKA